MKDYYASHPHVVREYPANHQSRLMKSPMKALEEKYEQLEAAYKLDDRKLALFERRMRQLSGQPTGIWGKDKYGRTGKLQRRMIVSEETHRLR